MEPANLGCLWQFALSARMAGDRELALTQFEAIYHYYPSHVGAYLEAAEELKALGRQLEAVSKLQLAFVRTQAPFVLEKFLSLLFEENAPVAVHELFLHAGHYPMSINLIQCFFNYLLAYPQEAIYLNKFPKNLVATLLSQDVFVKKLIGLRVNHFDSFIAILTSFEPLTLSFTEASYRPLVSNNIFILLTFVAEYKKNTVVTNYIIGHIDHHIAQLSFAEICKVTASLLKLTNHQFVISLFARVAMERYSSGCLLMCLIMLGYFPEEPCLETFKNKTNLLKLLPKFCVPQNEKVLKNIFTHLLQKRLITFDEFVTLQSNTHFIESIKTVDEAIKPIYQENTTSFGRPHKLNVALCISGQLRGYKEAFVSIKKTIVDTLQPDIFVHVWQDVGFKEPYQSSHANRVFQGQFLKAYNNLFLTKDYKEIKEMLASLFVLFNENTVITKEQLIDFYQTDFVIVEDDQAWPYAKFNNQKKMFHKIDACNQMVQEYGQAVDKQYDLVIRLRPDLEIQAHNNIDWQEVAENCNSKKAVYVDRCVAWGNIIEAGYYVVGDQVAIGSQDGMNFYANLPKLGNVFNEQGLINFSEENSHSLLANGLWVGGYTAKALPFAKGKLINTSLKAEEILKAIQKDVVNLDKKIAANLVGALEQDIVNKI
jgi:hypothetical protein